MRILQVSNFLSPVHGGSAEVPLQLSKALVKNGHNVSIYTSNLKLDKPMTIPGVAVTNFNSLIGFFGFSFTPGIIKAARENIRNFDIIHLHNFRTFQNMIIHHYAKKYGIPYVVQAHGSLATFFQKGLLKKTFDMLWGKNILNDAAKLIAVTGIEAEQYRKMGVSEDKIEVIPHGIDLDQFSGPIEKGLFRKKFNISDSRKIILYLGRINKIKGLDFLIKAFKALIEKHPDITLAIVGPDDGYLSTLKKMASELKLGDNVVFTGPLYGDGKRGAYIDSDIYILPSNYEIFGIAILEAWACGKPVITTDRCGLADVVKDKAGLVTPYDVKALEDAIIKLLDDASLKAEFGRQGRKLIEEKYNWEKIALQIEDLYHRIR